MAANTAIGKSRGFTLAELLVVLLLVALLASLTAPVLGRSIEQAKESVLRENLYSLRKALDDYCADKGVYPQNLADLIEHKYLRSIPVDPLLVSSEQWMLERGSEGEIVDVGSASMAIALDGTRYADW
jgi:general secretion pathway protein G